MYKICKSRKRIFSVFCNISPQNSAILLTVMLEIVSFDKIEPVCEGNGPLLKQDCLNSHNNLPDLINKTYCDFFQ